MGPTLLISLYSETSRWAYEYLTGISPPSTGPCSVLHCMKSLQSSPSSIGKSRTGTTRRPEKDSLALPAQRGTVCFGCFTQVVKFLGDRLSSFRPKSLWKVQVDPARVRDGAISPAYPELSCSILSTSVSPLLSITCSRTIWRYLRCWSDADEVSTLSPPTKGIGRRRGFRDLGPSLIAAS